MAGVTGAILTIGFSICNLLLLIQILIYVFKVKKFYRLLDEGKSSLITVQLLGDIKNLL